MKTFLVCAFIAAVALCILAAVAGLMPLYYLGGVIATGTAVIALTGTWLTDLLKEEEQ